MKLCNVAVKKEAADEVIVM